MLTPMVTVKQLAKMARVSPSTIMNVIHGRTNKVNDETLKRVQKIIKETRYVPNMGGRLLGNRGSRLIGVIITWARRAEQNVVQDPFFGEIIGALEQEIRRHGYFMMLYTSENTEEGIKKAESWLAEGLIVLGSQADGCTKFMQNTKLPLVFIDSYFNDDGLPYVNVGLQDRRGGYLMTEYLIQQGHRRIAFLADGDPLTGLGLERLRGFQDALNDNSLPVREEDYIPITYDFIVYREFLRQFAGNYMKKYTALFFNSDFHAVNTITTLADMGIRVPSDISVCGFDGNVLSVLCRPLLTTVKQVVSDKAIHAVAQLIRLIRKEPLEDRIIRLDVSLTIGDSVRDLRKGK